MSPSKMTMKTHETPTGGELAAKPVSAETAAELYRLLTYYRNFMPFCVEMSEAEYAITQEAINVDAALNTYRTETGKAETSKPSVANVEGLAPATGSAPPLQADVSDYPPASTRIG